MRVGQDSTEQIRRREVSRALEKMDLSPEAEETVERLSHSLVDKLLRGPISEVMARPEADISFRRRRDPEAPCGLERHRGRAESPRSKTDHQVREDGKPYIKRKFDIGSDRVSKTLHDLAERRIGWVNRAICSLSTSL